MNNKRVFSEVYAILVALGDYYINLIPYDILSTIRKKRDLDFLPNFNNGLPLNEQNISRDALNIIAKLHIDYWCNSIEEKKKLYAQLQENERKANERLIERMFKN